MNLDRFFQRIWYGRASLAAWLLLPLSWIFAVMVSVRRWLYEKGILPSVRIRAPVIVVGNITVGGTGKTPFTLWLAGQLAARGWRTGVVLRGYGGRSSHWPRIVDADTPWQEVGDEAALIATQSSAIVVAGPKRAQAAQMAVEHGADIVISDDGLQHYRLQRDAELLVVDEQRQYGNGHMLPAGPLREPLSRARDVDLCVTTRRETDARSEARPVALPSITALSCLRTAVGIKTGVEKRLTDFAGSRIHAVAAIGHPEAFFAALRALGLDIDEHAHPDHAVLKREDITFADAAEVLMTQKDAVKCRAFADERHWAVPLQVEVSAADAEIVLSLIERIVLYRR